MGNQLKVMKSCKKTKLKRAVEKQSAHRENSISLQAIPAKWLTRILPLLLVMLIQVSAQDSLAQPSFDCAKAEGSAEELVCQDAELAQLDRQLASIYASALKTAEKDGWGSTLKAEQRGWIKGRDDCWKADDLRACVQDSYEIRISEFQSQFRLVASRGPFFFSCEDRAEVVISYFESLKPSAIIERGDRSILLFAAQTGSGAKYEGRNVLFWEHQGEASVEWDGQSFKCNLSNP